MKRLFSAIMLCLLCLPIFSMFVPKVQALNPSLSDYDRSPSSLYAGQSFTAWYYVYNPSSSPTIGLGLSIRKTNTYDEIVDTSNDNIVSAYAGYGWYYRQFVVPLGTAAGSYDVAWAIWSGKPGSSTYYGGSGWQTAVLTVSSVSVTFSASGLGWTSGTVLVVGGVARSLPYSAACTVGQSISFEWCTPVADAVSSTTRYEWWGTSGLSSARSGSFTVPVGGGSVVASYATSYLVSFVVNPAGSGTASPSGGQWIRSGSMQPISASPSPGYSFQSWSASWLASISFNNQYSPSTIATINGAGTITANFGVIPKVADPTFSPTPGTYTGSVSVTISCGTSGATIHYTTDGTTPTIYSPTYSGPIVVGTTTTFYAKAFKSGYTASNVVPATYTIAYTVTFSASGLGWTSGTVLVVQGVVRSVPYTATYNVGQTVSFEWYTPVSDYFSSTTRYEWWGTNGLSTVRSGSFTVPSGGGSVTASYATSYLVSFAVNPVGSGTTSPNGDRWIRKGTMQPVSASPSSGYSFQSWSKGLLDSISFDNPSSASTNAWINGAGTITANFIVTPRVADPYFSPIPSTYENSVSISISCDTWFAVIHYTTDGSTPTTSSPKYNGPILVTSTTSFRARAFLSGYSDSNVVPATYTIVYTASVTFSASGLGWTSGTVLVVQGVARSVPYTASYTMGQSVSFEWYTTVSDYFSSTTRYEWWGTTGLSTVRSGSFTVPSGGGSVTASYATSYLVSFVVNPAGSGTASPSGVQWIRLGAQFISASPSSGYSFQSWSKGLLDSISFDNPSSSSTYATINGAGTITANFVDIRQAVIQYAIVNTVDTTDTPRASLESLTNREGLTSPIRIASGDLYTWATEKHWVYIQVYNPSSNEFVGKAHLSKAVSPSGVEFSIPESDADVTYRTLHIQSGQSYYFYLKLPSLQTLETGTWTWHLDLLKFTGIFYERVDEKTIALDIQNGWGYPDFPGSKQLGIWKYMDLGLTENEQTYSDSMAFLNLVLLMLQAKFHVPVPFAQGGFKPEEMTADSYYQYLSLVEGAATSARQTAIIDCVRVDNRDGTSTLRLNWANRMQLLNGALVGIKYDRAVIVLTLPVTAQIDTESPQPDFYNELTSDDGSTVYQYTWVFDYNDQRLIPNQFSYNGAIVLRVQNLPQSYEVKGVLNLQLGPFNHVTGSAIGPLEEFWSEAVRRYDSWAYNPSNVVWLVIGMDEFAETVPAVQTGYVTVSGHVYYTDNQGNQQPMDGVLVELYDKEWWGQIQLGETQKTTSDGYFNFGTFSNVDNDLGESGTLDLFFKVRAENSGIKVVGLGASHDQEYQFNSVISWDVTDGDDPWSVWCPSEMNAAFNIFSIANKGFKFYDVFDDTPPLVTYKWYPGYVPPNESHNSHYNAAEQMIHIEGSATNPDEWDTSVILHEYGHFIMDHFADLDPPSVNYGADRIHDWDSVETPETAWIEGWADFFQSAVKQYYGLPEYQYFINLPSTSRIDVDAHWSTISADQDKKESTIASILWDIYDAVQDDRNGDGIGDTLGSGYALIDFNRIWNVFHNYDPAPPEDNGHDHPWTIHEFWDGWLALYDFRQEIWAIYYEHGINKDIAPPNNPNSYTSSHGIRTWSSDNTIEVTWSGATDDTSGVYGYSFVWDNYPDTLPPEIANPYTSTSDMSVPLSDGNNWYLHVRTRDDAGNWASDAYDIGPFYIDNTPPTTGIVHVSGSSTMSLIANDATSGVNAIYCRINGGMWNAYSGPFSIPAGSAQSIESYSRDNAGNDGSVMRLTVYYLTISTNHGSTSPTDGWYDSGLSNQIGSTASGYTWNGWIGSGAGSYTGMNNPATITMNGPMSETAYWIVAQPFGSLSGTVTDSQTNSAIWGATVSYTGPSSGSTTTDSNGYYAISGLASGTYTLTVSMINYNSQTQTAIVDPGVITTTNFQLQIILVQYNVTFDVSGIGSDFTGIVLRVGETDYAASDLPLNFLWDADSVHTFLFASPLGVSSGERYVWGSTTGLSTGQTDSLTVTIPGTVTGNYFMQYYLSITTNQGSTTPISGWYDSGSTVQINANAADGYVWGGWTGSGPGSYTGQDNPTTIQMNGPISETAFWSAVPPQNEKTVFSDDFESYTVGTFPSSGGWELVWNGMGDEYQTITDAVSHSPERVLQLLGSNGWSANVQRIFSSSSSVLGYEAYIRCEGNVAEPDNVASICMWNIQGQAWGKRFAGVYFASDGYIYTEPIHLEPVYIKLMSYEPNIWYKVRVIIDRAVGQYNVWVDDALMAENVAIQDTYEIGALMLAEGWAGYKVYFDDVKVFETQPARLPRGLQQAASIWDGSEAYIFGGTSHAGGPFDQILRYNPATDSISQMTALLPDPVTDFPAVWTGQYVYVFGGYVAPLHTSDKIVRYDPSTDTTTVMGAKIPTFAFPLYSMSAIWDGNYAYLFGGYDGYSYFSQILRYDPANDEITVMSATLPTGTKWMPAVWSGTYAYIFGGRTASGASDQIVRYDPVRDSIAVMSARLPTGILVSSAVWAGSCAYIFGGSDINNQVQDAILRYDPSSDSVTTIDSLPTPRRWTCAVWDGSSAYVFGGEDANGQDLDSIFKFSPAGFVRAWKDDSSLGLENDRLYLHGLSVAGNHRWFFDYLIFKDTGTMWYQPWGELAMLVYPEFQWNAVSTTDFEVNAFAEADKAYLTYSITSGNLREELTYTIYPDQPYVYVTLSLTNVGSTTENTYAGVQFTTWIAGDHANDYFYVPGHGQGEFDGVGNINFPDATETWIAEWDQNKGEGCGMLSTKSFKPSNMITEDFGIGEGFKFISENFDLAPGQTSATYDCYFYFFTGAGSQKAKDFYDSRARGLVGYWKFDEGSEGIAHDYSGNGNDGTIYTATWVDGKVGKAIWFNGIDSYVSIPDSSSLDIAENQISVEFWVKFDNPIDDSAPYMKFYDKGNAYNSAMRETGQIRFTFWVAGDSSANLDSIRTSWLAGIWYHIAEVYDGNIMSIFVNGALDNSMPMTGNVASTTYPVALGAYTLGGQWFLHGVMDEFKIYNYARTAQDIIDDYNSGIVSLPWKDDFNYDAKNEMEATGWRLDGAERATLFPSIIQFDNDGSSGSSAYFLNHFPSGIYDLSVEAKSRWVGREVGDNGNFYVITERHSYAWAGDGFYPNYMFVRDGIVVMRFDGYIPVLNQWTVFTLEKIGNVFYMYQDGQLKNTYTETDAAPDQLVGVGIGAGWLSTMQYDYVSVAAARALYQVVATLNPLFATVWSGSSFDYIVRIHNTGNVRDTYGFRIIGLDEAWCTFSQDMLTVDPDQEGMITVRVAPPADLTPLVFKAYPFSVEVISQSEPTAMDTTSGTMIVTAPVLAIIANSPVNILVTAPNGLRVGYDQIVGAIFNEIPGATYTGPGTEPQMVEIPNPLEGPYTIDIFGTGTGSYTIDMESHAPDGSITDTATWIGTTELGQYETQTVQLETNGEIADIVAPTTDMTITGIGGQNGWYVSNIVVTLIATDDLSGIATTQYSFNGVTWNEYANPFQIEEEGVLTIYFRSIDNSGNVEATESRLVQIDKTPPVIAGGTTIPPNANGWHQTDVTVRFVAIDTVSGIDSVTPDQILTVEGADQSVLGIANDSAGNIAYCTVGSIDIDKSKPSTTLTIGLPKYGIDPTYVSTTTDFTLETTDEVSDIEYTEYRIDSGAWKRYSVPFQVLYSGSHAVYYHSIDLAGNTEEIGSVSVVVKVASVSYCGELTSQYSDPVNVMAKLIDMATGQGISGKTIAFEIGSQSVTAVTNGSGFALAKIVLNQLQGQYTVFASFSGDPDYSYGCSDSKSFTITMENAIGEYTGDTVVPTTAKTINLRGTIFDSQDLYWGNLTKIRVTFRIYTVPIDLSTPYKTVGPVQVTPTSTLGVGIVTAQIPILPENGYVVIVSIDADDNIWFCGPTSDPTPLMVYLPTGSFVTGGGWIQDPSGSKGNFGFNVKYTKSGSVQGHSVYIFRQNGWDYIVKSNSWTGLAIEQNHAYFEAKCVVQMYNPATSELVWAEGNYKFRVDIWDNDANGGKDIYQIRVWDKVGVVWHEAGSSPYGYLQGGNIMIHDERRR